jgi:hypothetical protein
LEPNDPQFPSPLPADADPVPYFSTPPPLPPSPPEAAAVPYFSTPAALGWVPVAAYSSIGRWHAANAVLRRNGIAGMMGESTPDGDTVLLVPKTEVEWSRELLGISITLPQSQVAPVAAATGPAPRVPLPVQYYDRPKSETGYYITMTLLYLAMGFVILVAILAVIYWQ